jgi:hypothetical protein
MTSTSPPSINNAVDVLQFEVVTADGEKKIANKVKNQDLFWALRGGGGALLQALTDVKYVADPQSRCLRRCDSRLAQGLPCACRCQHRYRARCMPGQGFLRANDQYSSRPPGSPEGRRTVGKF